MFAPVEVYVEGLAGVVAGALFDEVAESDQIDGFDWASRFFEFFDSGGDLVDCLTDPLDGLRGASVGFSSLSELPVSQEAYKRSEGLCGRFRGFDRFAAFNQPT